MILQLALTLACCAMPCTASVNTLFFKPHAAPSFKNFTCPDQTQCPVGNTCCQTAQNQFGCCPYKNAVCCSDGVHCCQSGATCHPSGVGCVHQQTPEQPPKPIRTDTVKADLEVLGTEWCPDQEVMCPKGKTCCQGQNQEYACCPFREAVCCPDKVHCCPSGTTCDSSAGRCNRKDGITIPWMQKTSSSQSSRGIVITDPGADSDRMRQKTMMHDKAIGASVVCPGGAAECPSGSTCCKLASGAYGCCPLPQAVCCSDNVHCCPSGMTCDISQGGCVQDGIRITWEDKRPARARKTQPNIQQVMYPRLHKKDPKPLGNVMCPDKKSSCPDNSSCCSITQTQFGCCPHPKAVCCSDGVHCCPASMICNLTSQTCDGDNGEISLPMYRNTPSRPLPEARSVKCGGGFECPNGNTCCKMVTGQWGCCPMPQHISV